MCFRHPSLVSSSSHIQEFRHPPGFRQPPSFFFFSNLLPLIFAGAATAEECGASFHVLCSALVPGAP